MCSIMPIEESNVYVNVTLEQLGLYPCELRYWSPIAS